MPKPLSKHFTADEFRCRCCGVLPAGYPHPELILQLETLRDLIARPIKITPNGGYRCPKNNGSKPGRVEHSRHLKGQAADIVVRGWTPQEIAMFAAEHTEFERGGIGIYPKFTHLDVRYVEDGGKARWKGK